MQIIKEQMDLHSSDSKEYCVFEYLYRDASNYKVWGKILVSGVLSQDDMSELRAHLESGEYFVAEQVGIPALYKELWDLSGGPTDDDHALHEFVALRAASENEKKLLPLYGELASLVQAFQSVTKWNYTLSPNFQTSFWP